jgi:hypothetical protein
VSDPLRTQSCEIDVGVLTSGSDFLPRRPSWQKVPVVRLEAKDDGGDWRFFNLRPVTARALSKALLEMARVCERIEA